MFRIIPEGEQVVIYQLGRFNRIAGPGPVTLAPKLDRVHQRLDIREQQQQIRVKVTTGGVPVELGLHYRAALNIPWCTSERDEQARLVVMDDWQRQQQRDDSAFHVVLEAVKGYERSHPLSLDIHPLLRLNHVVPGSEANLEVLAVIREQLAKQLRKLGYRVNLDTPLYLTIDGLPNRLGEALDRDRADRVDYERRKRIWQDMLTYTDNWPPQLQAHMLSIVEQLQPPPITIPAGDTTAQLNTKVGPGGEQEIEVEIQRRPAAEQRRAVAPAVAPPAAPAVAPAAAPPAAPPAEHPAPAPTAAASPSAPPAEAPLSEDDVAQLKLVPPRSQQLGRTG